MKAKSLLALTIGLYLLLSSPATAQKLKLGLGTRLDPQYYLTVNAGAEKGFWKENGLDVEAVPFASTPAMTRAVAARELYLCLDIGLNTIQATARGLPAKMVSDLDRVGGFFLYVLAKSPIREPKDLKGARIGVIALGGAGHAYGRVITKALGVDKDVKFVGAGGVGPTMAALKVGSIDGIVISFYIMMELKIKGEARDVAAADEYLPKPWLGRVVWAHKDFIKEKPDVVRRMVKAILQGVRFWKNDSAWAIANIKSEAGVSEEAAREIYKILRPTEDGSIERKAIENASAFLVEYNILARDKVPPLDELYTDEFVRAR